MVAGVALAVTPVLRLLALPPQLLPTFFSGDRWKQCRAPKTWVIVYTRVRLTTEEGQAHLDRRFGYIDGGGRWRRVVCFVRIPTECWNCVFLLAKTKHPCRRERGVAREQVVLFLSCPQHVHEALFLHCVQHLGRRRAAAVVGKKGSVK